MTQAELQAKLSGLTDGLDAALAEGASEPDKIMAALLLSGIALVGELLLDVKRIADAAEQMANRATPGITVHPNLPGK